MRTFDELEALWAQEAQPRDSGTVELIVVRPKKGARHLPARIEVSPEQGVHGDRWSQGEAPNPDSQISLINARVADLVADGAPLELFGDNFIVAMDISEDALPVGTRLRMGTVLMEVVALPHTGCKQYRERFGSQALRWIHHKAHRARRLRGVYCRVIEAGVVATGDPITKLL
jgi:MOSC domain-containing protein YiiM